MKKLLDGINRRNWLKTLLIFCSATLISAISVSNSALNRDSVPLIYILAVVVVSRITEGYCWGIISSIAGVIGVNFFFTYPYWKLDFSQPGYPAIFLMMLVASVITSAATAQMKEQARISAQRESRTAILYEVSKKLLAAKGIANIAALAADSLHQMSGYPAAFYTEDPTIEESGIYLGQTSLQRDELSCPSEYEAVHLAYITGKPAGRGTEQCPSAKGLYLPVASDTHVMGVAGILCGSQEERSHGDMIALMEMMLSQVALALEKQELSDEQNRIMMESEKEKMRSNLLRAISHDLRTPLTGILGASSAILENKTSLSEKAHDKLVEDIKEDSQWLIRMVENLLSVTRMSGGAAALKKAPEAVEEVVGEAVARIRKQYPGRNITVKVPEEFVMASMDGTLIEQVLINLMENAVKHSGSSKIWLTCFCEQKKVIFQVCDDGIGLDPTKIPEMLKGTLKTNGSHVDSSRGMGIGLPICVSIVKAHGGCLTAENRPEGGAVFRFWIPLGEDSAENNGIEEKKFYEL